MRILLWLLTLIATAIGLAMVAKFNLGNVVFFYPPYRIDLSLNFFLLLTVLSFGLLYAILRAIDVTLQMPAKVAGYRKEKRERAGNKAMRESLKALFEGRFGHAEKAATRATELPENAGLAALIGARAAHRMRQSERRDAWLSTIEEDATLKTARLMTTVELLVDEHKSENALTFAKELNASGTRHIHALRLTLKANHQAKNWPEVLRLVRSLDKHNALHPTLSRRLRELAYEALLSDKTHDVESIRRVWAGIPADDRVRPYVATRAANAYHARGLPQEASAIIEKALAVEWDDRLIRAYRNSAAGEATPVLLAQIERCENWKAQHPTDPELAITLGALCVKQKLWGKAQLHLQQALSDAIEASTLREAHLALAQLHEALSQPEKAAEHYRLCALTTKS